METQKVTYGEHQKKIVTYARRKHLVERYHFWSNIKRMREDDVIKKLQYEECFYAAEVIYKILKHFKPDPELEKQLEELKRVVL